MGLASPHNRQPPAWRNNCWLLLYHYSRTTPLPTSVASWAGARGRSLGLLGLLAHRSSLIHLLCDLTSDRENTFLSNWNNAGKELTTGKKREDGGSNVRDGFHNLLPVVIRGRISQLQLRSHGFVRFEGNLIIGRRNTEIR
jgi:hypothetical protein